MIEGAIEGSDGDIIFGRVKSPAPCSLLLRIDGKDYPTHNRFPLWNGQQMTAQFGGIRAHIPAVREEREFNAELYADGVLLDRKPVRLTPIRHKQGHAAGTMRSLQPFPLIGFTGTRMEAGQLQIVGLALPPDGNPASVSVEADPDIALTFEYPLPNPNARETYWYWPNSDFSTFRATIDFAGSRSRGSAYRLQVHFAGETHPHADIKNVLWIPKDLGAYENFPPPANLSRVHRFHTVQSACIQGYTDARKLLKLARRFGFDQENPRILDWGCGHGRVIRHFRTILPEAKLFGVDIDPDNIGWARGHLPEIDFRVGPLMPPTDYPDASFDLIYGISVMTHLSGEVRDAWLAEVARLLAPGGIALLTFAGDASVAFSSRFTDDTFVRDYLQQGVGRDLPSKDLEGVIEDYSYYKNVTLNHQRVATVCQSRFSKVEVIESLFGYQDMAVLRQPKR